MVLTTDGTNQFIGNDYYLQSTLAIARAGEITQLGNQLYGSGKFSTNSQTDRFLLEYRPSISGEPFTPTSTANANIPGTRFDNSMANYRRFSHTFGWYANNSFVAGGGSANSYTCGAISSRSTSTSHTTSQMLVFDTNNNIGASKITNPSSDLFWAVGDFQSFASFLMSSDRDFRYFLWTGVLKEFNPLLGGYIQSCAAIASIKDADASGGDIYQRAFRGGVDDGNVSQAILTTGDANYAIACADTQTPGTDLWASDLWLLDDDGSGNGSKAGRCSNLLLAKGSSFVVGDLYQIQTAHVDGGSPNFLCVADWGADKILMRITNSIGQQ